MRAYKVVDAFSDRPFLGNPVAVILDAEGLDTAAMQAIARWTNLSETTFLLPARHPDADYTLRIFTPLSELPFAGHPTLGSAHAIIEAGRHTPKNGVLVQECGVGLIRIEVTDRLITLALPSARIDTLSDDEVAELEAVLGAPVVRESAPALVNVGPTWIVAQMTDAAAVLALKPDFARSAVFERRLNATGITVFGRYPDSSTIEVRSFAPSDGIDEDPVCGSGNGSVAAFRIARGLIPPVATAYAATQGRCIGRDGHIQISVDEAGQIYVGGACVTCVDGFLAS
ncbi:PhzF family phenazine biosynthesis protein [Asticcacaulis sp.]|uniref:PhzF family phenazine biosynthesis protein n=1 Tax=Asticcacaulis sp. TaxID=1872648 RepID=UPI003F7C1A04